MINDFKVLAVIPARSGSKGLPGKNIKELCGKPLIHYTIKQALESELFNKVVVSSDSDEILEIAKQSDISYVFKRNKSLSTDDASKWEVFKDLVLRFEKQTGQRVEYLVDLDVTVPRRKTEHVDTSIDMMIKNNWINPMHTTIPGPDGQISYGGLCFPKDTNALLKYMEKMNTPHEVLEGTIISLFFGNSNASIARIKASSPDATPTQ